MSINFLKLTHLADSAFPIGAAAHSFGLETLAAEGQLRAAQIEPLLTDLLWASGQAEAIFLRLAHRLGSSDPETVLPDWLRLNHYIAASKSARESRMASATLGRRFLQTVAQLEAAATLQRLHQATLAASVESHYCAAFGLVGGYLQIDADTTVLAFLQQHVMGLVSACQRLLPIGQSRASEILWHLKPTLIAVAEASSRALPRYSATVPPLAECLEQLALFTPLVDWGSMRHPTLTTRLFIS